MRALIVDMTIEGEPASKGRPRKGRGGRVYTPDETRAAEEAVAWHARIALGARPVPKVSIYDIRAWFLVGDYRRRDQDNMLKLVMDACNKVVWADDSQVRMDTCEIVRGVPRPATVIRIWEGWPDILSDAEMLASCRGWPGRRA